MSDEITTEDVGRSLLLLADTVAAANTESDDEEETNNVDKPVSSASSTHPCDVMMIEGAVIVVAKAGGACADLDYGSTRLINPLMLVERYLRRVGTILADPNQRTIVQRPRDEMGNQA